MPQVRQLHLAKSLEELNSKIEDSGEKNIPRLLKSSEKLFLAAELAKSDKDEERAYLYYMRYFQIAMIIQKSSDYSVNKEKYRSFVQKAKNAIVTAEELRESLKKRYDSLNDLNERNEKLQVLVSHQPIAPEDTNGISTIYEVSELSDPTVPLLTSCSSLMSLINKKSTSFLLLDTRPANDYIASSINIPQCINIPEEILKRGITAESVTNQLSSESRILWSRRGRHDLLILLDWRTETNDFPPPLQALLDAIIKWDPSNAHKSPPHVLKGGFELWFLSYPHYCTNSTYRLPSQTIVDGPTSDLRVDLSSIKHGYDLNAAFISTPSPGASPVGLYPLKEDLPNNTEFEIVTAKDTADFTQNCYFSAGSPDKHGPDIWKPNMLSDNLSSNTYAIAKNKEGVSNPTLSKVPTVQRHLKPTTLKKNIENINIRIENDDNISHVLVSDLMEKCKFNETVKENLKDRFSVLNNVVTPHVPSRSSKPKQLLDSLCKESVHQENKLLEQNVKLEQKIMERLSKIENTDSCSAIQRELDKFKEEKIAVEAKLKNVVKENKELWNVVNAFLASTNNATESEGGDQNLSKNARLMSLAGSGETETVQSVTTEADAMDREALADMEAKHLNLQRQVEEMRRVRKEKERSLIQNAKKEELLANSFLSNINRENMTAGPQNASYQPLARGSPEPASSGKMRRSHSAYDLSQMDSLSGEEIESKKINDIKSRIKPSRPSIDRSMKPLHTTKLRNVNAVRHRDFGPTGRGRCSNTGLKNLGNTCYMNSIVQCLVHSSQFAEYFLKEKHFDHLNERSQQRGDVAVEFGAVVQALKNGMYKSVAMRDFKYIVGNYNPTFRGFDQHDAHEFLMNLTDWLHNDLNLGQHDLARMAEQDYNDIPDEKAAQEVLTELNTRERSIVTKMFHGLHRSVIQCQACSWRSLTFEPFSALSLAFPSPTKCSLMELLAHYYRPTLLEYNCSRCGRTRQCQRRVSVWQLPQVLMLHLNRFEQSNLLTSKTQAFVDFPLNNLRLEPFIAEQANSRQSFSLFGVSNHYGTMDGGHYTAFCLSNDRWLKFDDHEVYQMKAHDIKTSAAYVLFYQCSW